MVTQSYEVQVDDGSMDYHIIRILPKKANIIKIGDQLNTEFNELKFKVGDHL